jgi:phosphinothricin acetyltransferase
VNSILRLAAESDAPAICAIYGPFCDTLVTFEEVAPTVPEMEQRIRKVTAQYPWLVCESAGAVAGYAYASMHRERAAYRWAVEVAAYVAESHRGRGVGRALYTALTGLLAAAGYHRAFGLISLPNPASVALHESVGFKAKTVFQHIGFKSGAWRSVGWWELALSESQEEPDDPVNVQTLRGTARWQECLRAGERQLRLAPGG